MDCALLPVDSTFRRLIKRQKAPSSSGQPSDFFRLQRRRNVKQVEPKGRDEWRESNLAGFRGPQGCAQKNLDKQRHTGEPLIMSKSLGIAEINLLDDYGDSETRESQIEIHV